MTLTLDVERQMLGAVLDLDTDELVDRYSAVSSTAALDQIKAAVAEACGILTEGVLGGGSGARSVLPPMEVRKMLLAAVLRCIAGHHCDHAIRGNRPLFGILAARVIACQGCLPRFFEHVARSDAKAWSGEDAVCDLCLRDFPGGDFVEMRTQCGPAILLGSWCDECVALVAA